jgi:hypothetical protein
MTQVIGILDSYAYRSRAWDIYVGRASRPATGGATDESRVAAAKRLRYSGPTTVCSVCSSRSSSRRVICDHVAAKILCRCLGRCFRTGRKWPVSGAKLHIERGK